MVEKTINLNYLKMILSSILEDKISREKGSEIAFELRQLSDRNSLKYEPIDKEDLIWDAILFIEGLDLKDSPDTYLHNDNDIKIYLKEHF
jgi:hypothetical protein